LVFDPLCEGTRGEWLHEIVTLAGLTDTVVPLVIKKLRCPSTEEEHWTVGQLCVLASIFAKDGYGDARKTLYEKFDRQEASATWLCGFPILNLDGLKGVLYVAKTIGNTPRNEPDFWEDNYLISEAYDRFGRETVHDALVAQAKICESTRKFLDYRQMLEQREARQNAERENNEPTPLESVENILASIDVAQAKYPHRLKYWGRRASESDITLVFDRMLSETRPEQLRRYLYVFGLREMPRLAPQILELATTAEGKLLDAVINALSVFQTAKIRNLGLRLLQETPPRLDAIRLFVKNYEPGDSALLESALPTEGDANVLHPIGIDLLNVFRETKTPELAGCMRWLYEHGPCSMCREDAAAYLYDMKAIEHEMVKECLWDAREKTRELAKSILAKSVL
jgi:hypothetical protein